MPGETLYEALERLKKYLRQCPQHGLMIRRATIKVAEAYGVSEIVALTNQMAMFNKKIDKLNATVVAMLVGCESCGGPHLTKDCDDKPMSSSEDACWVNQRQGNFQAGGSNGNTLSYKQGPLGFYQANRTPFQQPQQQHVKNKPNFKKKSNFEELMTQYIAGQNAIMKDQQASIHELKTQALSQMPKYVKFLKDLLTNVKKLEDLSTVIMSEECSAILNGKLPKKMYDPRSFTIPCLIRNLSVNNALADLGASINLMPYSMYAKLGLVEPKLTHMTIQLVDRSIKYPRGIMENLLVKVG
ncbi:hypothetical protein Tco_0933345 [Tanacetum coccineum]